MRKDDFSRLLNRFLSAREENKEPYFDADEVDDLLSGFEDANDYTYFEEVLALGLRLHPGNNNLKIKKSQLYISNEEYEKALTILEDITDTDHEDLPYLKMDCYCGLKQYGKVIEYTEELISNKYSYLENIFEYTAPLLNDMDMIKEARDYVDRGLKLFPKNLILMDELCYILETEGDMDKAIQVCNEIIDNNPYSYDNWFTLGRLYSMSGDFGKAVEAFDFALTCNDSDTELKILKAYCLYMNESYEKAIEVYQEIAIAEKEMSPRIKQLIAESYIKLEEFEKAYSLFSEIIQDEKVQNDPTVQINYIHSCLETEHLDEAYNLLIQIVERYPDNIRILSLLALTYLEMGNEDMAKETANRLMTVIDKRKEDKNYTEEELERLFQTGQQLHIKGDIDNALKYYKKILEISPEMPYMHMHIAMAYLTKGEMELFDKHYKQTSPIEIQEYLQNMGIDMNDLKLERPTNKKSILTEELVKQFLNNKDNKN